MAEGQTNSLSYEKMEVDFDKEIDTLLRKAQRDGPVLVGDLATQHLDADEISAFAENAMPETSRPLYLAHLAGCDRCRKILSNLLVMNSEVLPAAAAAPGAITIAERNIPWYRQLFLFPNLAYVMGSLVLVFAGFLGFTIVRNSGNADLVSQMPETETTRGGPNFQTESTDGGAVPNSALAAANSNANTTTSGVATNASREPIAPSDERGPAANRGDNNFAVDGSSADSTMVAPAPPPAAAAGQPVAKDLSAAELAAPRKAKEEDKAARNAPIQEAAKNDAMPKQQYPGAMNQSQQNQIQSGPMNRNDRQYQRQLEDAENRRARALEKKSLKRDEDDSSGRKVVSGKTFERKDRVWYDISFQGRPTINVRRGTPEFNRLDGGLRSIANSLSGTIVVVWGAKAYRIQ